MGSDHAQGPDRTRSRSPSPNHPTSLDPGRRPELFLSYLVSDTAVVKEVSSEIERRGIRCFYAGGRIEDADEWLRAIEQALHRCDALVAFVQPAFPRSEWTDQEVGYALGQKKLVIPVMLQADFTPYGFFRRFQAIEGTGHASEVAQRITEALWRPGSVRPLLIARLLVHLSQRRDQEGILQAIERLEGLGGHEVDAISFAQAVRRNRLLQDPPFDRRIHALLERFSNDDR